MRARFEERGAGAVVELHHGRHGRPQAVVVHQPAGMGRNHDSCAQGLCQVQRVARPCAGVAHDAVRVRHAEHGQAVLGFGVVDGVAAAHQGAGLAHGVGAALQDGGGHRSAQLLVECQQVECHQGLRSHRKHVGQGVGRSYASELVRVVHDGREEVDGEDCRRVVAQPVDRRVVARLEPEQQARPLAVLRGVRGDHEGVAQRPAAGGRRSLRVSAGGRSSTGVPVGSGSRCAQSASTGGRSRRA